MKATLVYDASTRQPIASVRDPRNVDKVLSWIECMTGEALDRESLVVETGVHLVNEVQSFDTVVADAGDEIPGSSYRYAVRRPAMGGRKVCEIVERTGDVELVEDDEAGWHVLRWSERSRSWIETKSKSLPGAMAERRMFAAIRALELLGADPIAAESTVNALVASRPLTRVEPIVFAARKALAI